MDVLALLVPNRHGPQAAAWSDDPFHPGACRDPLSAEASPELGESDLRRLLAAMRDETPKPYCIEILLCPYLKTYVASARIEPPVGRVRIPSPDDPIRALYSCDKIGEHDVRDFDSLVAAFWATRGADIVKGDSLDAVGNSAILKIRISRTSRHCGTIRLPPRLGGCSRRRRSGSRSGATFAPSRHRPASACAARASPRIRVPGVHQSDSGRPRATRAQRTTALRNLVLVARAATRTRLTSARLQSEPTPSDLAANRTITLRRGRRVNWRFTRSGRWL